MSKRIEKVMRLRRHQSPQAHGSAVERVRDAQESDVAERNAWGDALRTLPLLMPPARAWYRLSDELDDRRAAPRPLWAAGLAAAVIVVALLVAGSIRLADFAGTTAPTARGSSVPLNSSTTLSRGDFDDLVAESRRLEAVLLGLPTRQALMRAGTAGTIVGLEDQIAFVDAQLSAGAAAGAETEFRRALWRERVELMNALVYVRAAQANRY